MDISETYIQMCKKATEIQKLVPENRQGETWYLSPKENYEISGEDVLVPAETRTDFQKGQTYTFGDFYAFGSDGHEFFDPILFIWLPRQDQLQEMVNGNNFEKSERFSEWASEEWSMIAYPPIESFEIMWLAFVMKEKYNKIWNGKDWIIQ